MAESAKLTVWLPDYDAEAKQALLDLVEAYQLTYKLKVTR